MCFTAAEGSARVFGCPDRMALDALGLSEHLADLQQVIVLGEHSKEVE